MKRKDQIPLTFSCLMAIILILSTGLNSSCRAQMGLVDMDKLTGIQWIHSYEDNEEGFEVYRPESYDFPPSRGRRGFKFMTDHTFINYEIAPTDGIITRSGTWKMGSENTCIIEFQDDPERNYLIEFIRQKNKLLKVKIEHD